ncbi:hypothetical protein [Ideonella paludis]|uniref:Uncharacterized protein n=1 Tax=Ideonella paludis TaxID=1233411 RepID=A0ABS5DV03_9BURK|nr:hypothetical protein [Ideonella paludis]MBQ0934701.1 hypothetical protein [Ideonella paludis]
MRSAQVRPNPFMMMTNPEVILRAVEHSERLSGLQRRICRPLDKPLIPKVRALDLADYDSAIDDEPELDLALDDDTDD